MIVKEEFVMSDPPFLGFGFYTMKTFLNSPFLRCIHEMPTRKSDLKRCHLNPDELPEFRS